MICFRNKNYFFYNLNVSERKAISINTLWNSAIFDMKQSSSFYFRKRKSDYFERNTY